jgi:hypothetical protein
MITKTAFLGRLGAMAIVLLLGIAPVGFAGGQPDTVRGYGPGMMGGYGPSMMGGSARGGYGPGMMGGGMMGGGFGGLDSSLRRTVDIRKAQALVSDYLAGLSDKNLKIDEIMEFEFNLYALIEEADTGRGAFELLIDPFNGTVRPEIGPNMMWNTKYGMMGARSGAVRPNVIGVDEAKKIAGEYLARIRGEGPYEFSAKEFSGYYTLDFKKNGMILGMVSVNAFTGQAWYHTWHGGFIREQEGMGEM